MKILKVIILAVIIITLIILGFLPLWPKQLMFGGTIRVNTWTKILLVSGFMYID